VLHIALMILLGAEPTDFGTEPASIDGHRRVTEAQLAADATLHGQAVYLDGKFGGATRERVMFRASKVILLAPGRRFDPARFASYAHDTNVRVFGIVASTGQRPAIDVERIERQPGDSQRYSRARRRLRDDDAAGLYALARRVRARHERYGGARLLEWARETSREAVLADLATHRHEPARLYDLADRAEALVGDDGLRRRIIEAALIAERRALPEDNPAPYFRLAGKWDRLLPRRTEPAAIRRDGLRIEERRLPAGQPDPCYALARRYERLVGDTARARELRRRGLGIEEKALGSRDDAGRYRLSRKVADLVQDAAWSRALLARATAIERGQLAGRPPVAYFRLAERYANELSDSAVAEGLIRQGLVVQEGRLDPRDLNGHLELALDYLTRLGDRAACVARLRACLELVPTERRVRAKLAELGLVEVGGRWYEAGTVQADPKLVWEVGIEKAIAAGRIELGMATRHVRRAWGEPERTDAVFTRNARTVQWTYPGIRPTRVLFRNDRVVAWSR